MLLVIFRILFDWAIIVGPVVAFYIIIPQLKRRTWEKVALALNAQYSQSQGYWQPKRMIIGESSGRKFTIEDGFDSSEAFTAISFNCRNREIPILTIYGNFWSFDNSSNWKYAFIKGGRKDFLAQIDPSIEERYKPFFRNLFQATTLFNYRFIRKGWITIRPDRITLYLRSGIMQVEEIKQTLQLLVKIVYRIESMSPA